MMSRFLYWIFPKLVLVIGLFYAFLEVLILLYNNGIDWVVLVTLLINFIIIYDQIKQIILLFKKDKRLYQMRTFRIINCGFFSLTASSYFAFPFMNIEFPVSKIYSFILGLFCLWLVSHDIVILVKSRRFNQPDISDFGGSRLDSRV